MWGQTVVTILTVIAAVAFFWRDLSGRMDRFEARVNERLDRIEARLAELAERVAHLEGEVHRPG